MAQTSRASGPSSRWACLRRQLLDLVPGTTDRRRQVASYSAAWQAAGRAALDGEGRRWVVLGDSAAQGVGASTFDGGWVGQLLGRLRAQDPAWQVVNLSVSGARTADVVDHQIPQMGELAPVELVTCAVGGNDLLRSSLARHRRQVVRLAAALPSGSVLANLPRGLRERRARALNQVIVGEAASHHLVVADLWAHTGPPWVGKYSTDHFHPSDLGHLDWTEAFATALGLAHSPGPPSG